MLSLIDFAVFLFGVMNANAFFTGHRWVNDLRVINPLIDFALNQNINHFYVGMALGTDLLAAEILTKRQLNWTPIIPCPNQDKFWRIVDQNRYANVLRNTNPIILYPHYSRGVMAGRNRWMINHSSLCLAVWDGRSSGGTAMTVGMAAARGIPVAAINPHNGLTALYSTNQQKKGPLKEGVF